VGSIDGSVPRTLGNDTVGNANDTVTAVTVTAGNNTVGNNTAGNNTVGNAGILVVQQRAGCLEPPSCGHICGHLHDSTMWRINVLPFSENSVHQDVVGVVGFSVFQHAGSFRSTAPGRHKIPQAVHHGCRRKGMFGCTCT
jgi:hypothetical protein